MRRATHHSGRGPTAQEPEGFKTELGFPVSGTQPPRARRFWPPLHSHRVLTDPAGSAAPIAVTFVVAGAAWMVAVGRMSGMDMGPGSALGSFPFFTATWLAMMAAMMLPSALPTILSFERIARRGQPASAAASMVFAAGYLAVWEVIGFSAFAADNGIRAADVGFLAWGRVGADVAGAAVVVAGLYELTPLKRACLGRCRGHIEPGLRNPVVAGLQYGADCVGCSVGLMLVLFALGAMSVTWMLVVAALIFVEKVPREGARLVVPIAVLLVGLGLWVALDSSTVPGLTHPM